MRYFLGSILFLIFISCNSSNSTEPSPEQKKIDSLTAEVNRRDEERQQEADFKKKQAAEQALIDERNSVLLKVTRDQPRFEPISFGGFKNISYTFFNDYDHKLDQVVMTVHYIKKNGSDAKTEQIVLTDVEPHSRQTIRPPDYSLAGTYIGVTFESIQCKEIDLCYFRGIIPKPKAVVVKTSSGVGAGSGSSYDPFKCK